MFDGLLAGLLWGLDTVILGIALTMSPFVSTEQAIFLAPFISTFIHDLCSSLWMFIYMCAKNQIRNVIKAIKTKSGKFIVLASFLGGPVGMTGYVLSIKYIGPAYASVISALFPAFGAFLSYIFLKEKMSIVQMLGLAFSIAGVIALGYTPGVSEVSNGFLGLFFGLVCAFGWALEAVIIAYGLKDPDIKDEHALHIRQTTSAIFYGIVILPILGGWAHTLEIIPTGTSAIILLSALFGTASYIFYYRAIYKLGAIKAMALNITYSAWAIVFGYFILNEVRGLKDIILSIIIIGGSIIAAGGIKEFFKKR